MVRDYIQLARHLSRPLAVEPATLSIFMDYLASRHSSGVTNVAAPIKGEEKCAGVTVGSAIGADGKEIGTMLISGVLTPRITMSAACGESFVSTNDAILEFNTLASKYSTIFLQVDSPGGSVTAVSELASAIKNSAAYVVGFTDTVAASGGYWILSACDEVVSTPSALVGSIGVYIPIMKRKDNPFSEVHYFSAGSKKLFGAQDVALSQEESDYFQNSVNSTYEIFTSEVAKFRGKSVEEIKNTEAGVYDGREALGLLVDRLVNNIMEV